jgi:hypothetical protein
MALKYILVIASLIQLGFGSLILTSPQVTNWGTWHEWEFCPNGTFVVGMQLKTESYQGAFKDDTSLNGVKFFCDVIDSKKDTIAIASGIDDFGSFGNKYFCEGISTGFQLKSEKSQTVFADDTAANGLRLYCNGGPEYKEGDGERFGDWTTAQECFTKQGICGIQTQVETNHGADNTALNNIRVKCCDIPDPAEICIPLDVWDLVIECDNTEAVSPTTCSYKRKVGISHSTTESEGQSHLATVYQEVGFSLNAATSVLNANFKYTLGQSTSTGFDWATSTTEMWSVETETSVSFDVPPKVKTQLLQTLGHCGIYTVRATRLKRVDTEAETLRQTITYIDL